MMMMMMTHDDDDFKAAVFVSFQLLRGSTHSASFIFSLLSMRQTLNTVNITTSVNITSVNRFDLGLIF